MKHYVGNETRKQAETTFSDKEELIYAAHQIQAFCHNTEGKFRRCRPSLQHHGPLCKGSHPTHPFLKAHAGRYSVKAQAQKPRG